jgi:protein-tyrosine phosphatase
MKRGSWISGEADERSALSVSPRVGRRRELAADLHLDADGRGLTVIDGVPTVGSLANLQRNVSSGDYGRLARRRFGMDMTWVTDRIAVGGGIWNADNMAAVARAGITHIIDMQIEFDDTPLAEPLGIAVCWNPVDDDFEPKSAEVFARGVEFALAALEENGTKLFIHCAAGVHRAPMMTLALLGVMGWTVDDGMDLIEARRPVADFAEVYVRSVEDFLNGRS